MTVKSRTNTTVDPLAEAARNYAAARARQEEAQRALADANAAVKAAREPFAAEIIKAAEAGVSQRDIHNRTGDVWTREYIRKVCRAAGIDLQPPAK